MALKATIFKAELQVCDLDRGYHAGHVLTLARHPSETDERLMVRLLAFALFSGDALQFGRGLSAGDEADLHEHDPTGRMRRWIDVGLPDERDLRKACARAEQVNVIAYGRTAQGWWHRNREGLERLANLAVFLLPPADTRALAQLARRNMRLHCTVQEGLIWFDADGTTVEIRPEVLKTCPGARPDPV